MADFSRKLQIWEGGSLVTVREETSLANLPATLTGDDTHYTCETLGQAQRPSHLEANAEPYSLQWFLDLEHLRHRRYAPWLPSLLEFTKHAGESLLALGDGLGTDWVQYARHGALVTVCTSSAEQLALVRRHFELRHLPARFLAGTAQTMTLESASVDVVCVSNLLGEISKPHALIEEAYRVLRPGGKILLMTRAQYDVAFWRRMLLPWTGAGNPFWEPGARFTKGALRGLLHRFVEPRVHKRHLRRGDVPQLWRLMPTSVLQHLLGRVLIAKAFKPLSAAMPLPVAA